MEINLYEEMNEKIADIIAIGNEPAFLYASAYIKQLRAEIKAFKDKLESGQLVELPLPKQDVVFHIIKRRRVNIRVKPELFYSIRMVSWKGFVYIISDKGNDGLWFANRAQAEACLKELQEERFEEVKK